MVKHMIEDIQTKRIEGLKHIRAVYALAHGEENEKVKKIDEAIRQMESRRAERESEIVT